jgi:hypothetical protein
MREVKRSSHRVTASLKIFIACLSGAYKQYCLYAYKVILIVIF